MFFFLHFLSTFIHIYLNVDICIYCLYFHSFHVFLCIFNLYLAPAWKCLTNETITLSNLEFFTFLFAILDSVFHSYHRVIYLKLVKCWYQIFKCLLFCKIDRGSLIVPGNIQSLLIFKYCFHCFATNWW